MSRVAFDFLTESPMWSVSGNGDQLSELSDDELRDELSRYRTHVLAQPPEPATGLGVSISARQGTRSHENEIKRSVLYFNEVLLPDPVFSLTEWTRNRPKLSWMPKHAPREELVQAIQYMRNLTPLVRLNRVRFVPSTHVLEPPEQLAVLFPDDAFENRVPDRLRDWFYERANVRKVVVDDQQRRLVLNQGPDQETKSIMIDFGQLGRKATQDYMNVVRVTDDGIVLGTPSPPPDDALMKRWVYQSVNAAAGDFLREVLADVSTAWKLGCSFVTACDVTADLLDQLRAPCDQEANAALTLDLPMVEAASFEQLADLLVEEAEAFDAFRFELKVTSEALAAIDDASERQAEGKKAAQRLARDQIQEVDRKLREATRKLKWNVPITVALLGAGALGFVAGGALLLPGLVASLQGSATVASTIRDHVAYRALPGYFLWRLKKASMAH